jgi:hypothetical protein
VAGISCRGRNSADGTLRSLDLRTHGGGILLQASRCSDRPVESASLCARACISEAERPCKRGTATILTGGHLPRLVLSRGRGLWPLIRSLEAHSQTSATFYQGHVHTAHHIFPTQHPSSAPCICCYNQVQPAGGPAALSVKCNRSSSTSAIPR